MLLEGKKVIVTAGVTGIGKATLIGMAKQGASVVSFSRAAADSEKAVSVIEAAKKAGNGKFCHIQCDVSKEDQVTAAVDKAVEFMGGLDAVGCQLGRFSLTPFLLIARPVQGMSWQRLSKRNVPIDAKVVKKKRPH